MNSNLRSRGEKIFGVFNAILMTLLALMCLSGCALAESFHVYDPSGVLNDQETAALESRAQRLWEEYGVDLLLGVTTDPIGMDGEGNDISFQDILGTPGDMVEDAAIRHMNMQQVRSALKKLPQRERAVLEMRYGLLGGRPLLQHEVASKMGISRSYIFRIETHAIALIRDEIMGKR